MKDIPTNPIRSNVICVLICHAMLWKFILLFPSSVFLLPKIVEKLTHTCSYFGGREKWRMLVPNSQGNARQAELQPRNMSCTLGGCLFPHHHREGTERIPGLGLDFARLSPLYRNVLILCHFEQSFCHKKGNSIACCLQNLESHDKDLKREAEYSALLIYSHDRP